MRLETSRFIAESYFGFHSDHANNGIGTSKRLFSKYPGRPSHAQLLAHLQTRPIDATHDQAISSLHDRIKDTLFPQWLLQLKVGINLALYGYGSKTQLLDDFVSLLNDYHVFRLKAYQKEDNLVNLLQSVLVNTFGIDRPGRNLNDLVDKLVKAKTDDSLKIILVVEMADAPSLRSPVVWRILVQIASVNIRLVLTFEHINSLLLGEEYTWQKLSLAWHNATTMRPYGSELLVLHLDNSSSSQDMETRCQGARFVLSSLTQTARSVFRVLAQYQLNQQTENEGSGNETKPDSSIGENRNRLGLLEWYQKCQDHFLVSNELAFRTQLTEFLDHELVKSVDDLGQHGNEFYIPFDREQIQSLLEICE